jgi:peptidyl-prolyl cis-trans isomerase SurA
MGYRVFMKQTADNSNVATMGRTLLLLAFLLLCVHGWAQVAQPGQPSTTEKVITSVPPNKNQSNAVQSMAKPSATSEVKGQAKSLAKVEPAQPVDPEAETKPAAGILVDQVLEIVNGDLILESDVNEERRFEAFQPYRDTAAFSRVKVIERLVNRDLILQQAKLNPDDKVTDAEAEKQLNALRKDIPACGQYHCETDAGWNRFVVSQGFTQPELLERWKQRMEILQFIEMRFRMGIQITPAQIQTYYDKTLLPQFASKHAPAPQLFSISDRIQEILLSQQVSNLLQDWLQQLKAQGTVRVMRPDEVQP